MNWNILS